MGMQLEVESLSVNFNTYEGTARVLEGISLSVDERESVALIGETGCGKSVTMKAILRVLPVPPAEIISGKVVFKGKELLGLAPLEMGSIRGKEIAMIPQSSMSSLNPLFTIKDQLIDLITMQGKYRMSIVDYYRTRGGLKRTAEAESKAVDMLREVVMPEPDRVLKSYPFELSGGMKQRVIIAMALVGNPSLLIADEPGTALDVTTSTVILDLMKKKIEERNLSVITITHNLAVARQLAKRIYVMYAGTIVESATTDTIFENPQHPYTQGLISSVPRLSGRPIEGIKGTLPNYYSSPTGCRFHPRCEHARASCSKAGPQLVRIGDKHWIACHQCS